MLGSERLPSCLLLLLLGAVLLAAAGHASAEVIDATDSPGPQWLQQRCCSAAAPAAGCQCRTRWLQPAGPLLALPQKLAELPLV